MYTHIHNLNIKQTNSDLKAVYLHAYHSLGNFPENLGNDDLCKGMEYAVWNQKLHLISIAHCVPPHLQKATVFWSQAYTKPNF